MPRTDSDRSEALRSLPAVDALIRLPELAGFARPVVLQQARAFVDGLRLSVLAGELDSHGVAARCRSQVVAAALLAGCRRAVRPRHRRVYNATGIVLHTGLGRAPLAPPAIDAIVAAAGYGIVEVDPNSGERDQREVAVAGLLTALTGTTGALVVNNCAAATTLMLTALTAGRDVVISRGELVEIGGGFRVPDVMRRSGCAMVEVGATNKTHRHDFAAVTREATAAYLKVHPSNFRLEGFVGTPSVAELVELAAEQSAARANGGELLVLHDLGSGLLCSAPIPGLVDEPNVLDSVADGAHVTCFSGDKLLGGPQCGILIGRRDLIAACRAHPLYRALRCDKLTLAALEATLCIYRDGDPRRQIPTLRMLTATPDELLLRSRELAVALASTLPAAAAKVVASDSFAGAGANPAKALPSHAVAVPGGDALAAALRALQPIAVFARRADGQVLLDARSLLCEDLTAVAAAIRPLLQPT
jgi:L-seryl-tRNA(Ser) seleniumtransferase